MTGTTITLNNVPPELHRSLKESAKRNKRPLNQEASHALESPVFGYREHRSTLRQPPPTRRVGQILVSREQLDSRADDLLDRGA